MKVNSTTPLPESHPPDRTESVGSSNKRSRTEGSVQGSDQALLSVGRDKVNALRVQLTNIPDVRADRVAALQQALRNGTYNVSDRQIAEAVHANLLARDNSASGG